MRNVRLSNPMPARSPLGRAAAVLLSLLVLLTAGSLPAQDNGLQLKLTPDDLAPTLTKLAQPAARETGAKISLEPADAQPGDIVTLTIVVTTPGNAYTYSMDESFAGRTRIEVTTAAGLTEVDKTFSSDRKPKTELDPLLDQRVEKFPGGVTWSRQFRVAADAQPADVKVVGSIRYQICDANSCRQINL